MPRIIVGIIGCVGSGKDTSGEYLVAKHGFKCISFAKKVKDVAHVVFGWDRDLLEGQTRESRAWREQVCPYWGITPRAALQKIGTDMFREHIDPDVWIKAVLKEIQANPEQNYVITDCRFENEIAALKGLGAKILYVERGEQPVWARAARAGEPFSEEYGIHISDWNPYVLAQYADNEIKNNGTLEELYRHIESAVY
jgi:dephospho-CoA kinase